MFQYRDLKFFINRKEKKKIKKTPKIFHVSSQYFILHSHFGLIS